MKDYPSLMPHWKRSVLPEHTQRRLVALRDALAEGRVSDAVVRSALDGLDLQAPETCISAAREIPGLTLPYQRDYRPLLAKHPALANIFLFHWDGFLREAALGSPETLRLTPFWVAAIILRLNDWVPQVRRAAVACLVKVLPKTDVAVLVDVADGLLHRRRWWTRGQDELAVLDNLVSAPGVLDGLNERLSVTYDRAPHRTLIAILKYPALDDMLPGLMRSAPNPAVRAIATSTLITGQARWPVGTHFKWIDKSMGRQKVVVSFETRSIDVAIPQDVLIATAAGDRSVQVRKVAMQALIDAPDLWQERQFLIDRMAKDRSGAIRAGIDYILRQQTKSR